MRLVCLELLAGLAVVLLGLGFFLFALAALAGSAVGVMILVLAFVVPLAVAIQAKSEGQTEDLGGRPSWTTDDEREHNPTAQEADFLPIRKARNSNLGSARRKKGDVSHGSAAGWTNQVQ
jgi:hypothetical protein